MSLPKHLWRFALHTGVHAPNTNALQHWNKQKSPPLLSAALQNRLRAGLRHCKYTYGDLLSIQVCRHPTAMHCSTGNGSKHSPLLSTAVQNRLRTGLCHCQNSYGDLLSIQVCSHPTPMHCSTGNGKKHPPLLSTAVQNKLTAAQAVGH